LKILVIAALLSLLLLLLYSRIYPYILILKKIFGGVAKNMADPPGQAGGRPPNSTAKSDGKLVRCVGCGTWVPAGRAIGNKAGMSVYCSRECIEKTSTGPNRKVAG
jgi:hypothetical protein